MEKGHVVNVLNHGYVKFVDWMGDDSTPLVAARMSTGNETGVDDKKDNATRDYLIRHQHNTPFEMGALMVEIQAPIFIAREIFRHRTFSFNEYSQRYSEALDLYYLPEMERLQPQSNTNKQGSEGELGKVTKSGIRALMKYEQERQRDSYETYLELGLARELARVNMPVSNYTKFMMFGKLRNWFDFINLRSRENVQYECRVYSDAIFNGLRELFPKTVDSFEENTFCAEKFSRSEMEVLKSIVNNSYGSNVDTTKLSPGVRREFWKKLGV